MCYIFMINEGKMPLKTKTSKFQQTETNLIFAKSDKSTFKR